MSAVLSAVFVCIFALSLTGCGFVLGTVFENNEELEGLCSQYEDIQLQDGKEPSDSEDIQKAPDNVSGGLEIVTGDGASTNESAFTKVVDVTKKSVVEINTEKVTYSQWSGQYIVQGAGSGVIISKSTQDKNIYYVVTNDHVIDGATTITVILYNGQKYSATLVGTDAITDIALLAIEADEGDSLTVAAFASPDNVLLDGQDIYVIGNPLGELGGSVSKGIISKTARSILISGIKMNLMQIDAAVNPGNSGGGLFDISGNLIGVVNAKYSDEGIEGLGFAIPINIVKSVVTDLSEHGYVKGRPWVGLTLTEKTYSTGFMSSVAYPTVTDNKGNTKGTYTNDLGGTSEFVFSEGDIICAVNGAEVNSITILQSKLLDYKSGDTVTLYVRRKSTNGKTYNEYSVKVVLTEYSLGE